MADPDYDLIVVGAGPGGYVAAIRAAQLGLRTAVVEREHLGGVCLNWGCIPTKALLRSAEMLDQVREAAAFGVEAGEAKPNLPVMVDRSRAISGKLNGGVGFLLKKNKVDVIWGEATLGRGEVRVAKPKAAPRQPAHPAPKGVKGAGTYTARDIVLATGARPRALKGLEPDGETVLTYFEAMIQREIPPSILVMGSGAIGMEFASLYRSLGVEVTIVEMLPEILPQEDAEIAALARKAFEARGIRILTGARATGLKSAATGATVTLDRGGETESVAIARVISAIGVAPNVEDLGLEELGVEIGAQGVATDGFGATNVAGVHAIGDVAGPPMLAHKAEREAVICVERLAGRAVHPLDESRVPACTYCAPQIASVGLTEAQAKAAGLDAQVGRFPFAANGKAMALGDTDGLIKTVFDAGSGALLGAHMIGPEVTELIHGYATAIAHETTDEHLAGAIYPHPTLSEALHESVLDASGRAIHI